MAADEVTLEEVLAVLRAEHSLSVYNGPGPATWGCSCGQSSRYGAISRTPAQAKASADRHLTAARKRIRERLATEKKHQAKADDR